MYNKILNVLKKGQRVEVINIVMIGAGGNAGPLIQKLARSMYAYQKTINTDTHWNNSFARVNLLIADGDKVEFKNLLRQPFIDQDVDEYKAEILGERYSTAYEVPIFHSNNYIENKEDISELFNSLHETTNNHNVLELLVGCVDNNATRQIMNEYFIESTNLVYIDAGIEGMVGSDEKELFESGYSGQVVCGLKLKGETILKPVGEVFPDILMDKDSRTPLQACGMTVVNHPQRMQTNETAALVAHSFLNNLIFDGVITSHYVNFNAQTMTSRPTYIAEDSLKVYKNIGGKLM